MLISVLVIGVVTNVLSQDIVGVNYSFKEGFTEEFNDQGCGNKERWSLVYYEYIGVTPPHEEATKAILASTKSCVSSFPIVFLPGSTLTLLVFTDVVSVNSGLAITVSSEDGKVLSKYVYGIFAKNFIDGWCELNVPILNGSTGYITLTGYSSKSEIVLIDSFQYLPKVTNIEENYTEFQVYLNDKFVQTDTFQDFEGSSDDDFEEERPDEDIEEDFDIIEPEELLEESPVTNSGLGTWSILLISLGVIIALALILVGAYQLGKIKGRYENPPFLELLEESTRVIAIPRARGVRR